MRAYHFLNRQYGLDDIRRRRLKIATLGDLNDPFELFGISLHQHDLRRAFRAIKRQLATSRGLLCFSRKWSNPVQWSHYAEKHRGLCLGFDVADDLVAPVNYSARRVLLEIEKLRDPTKIHPDMARIFLYTKYSHWRYEHEIRSFVSLDEKDPETQLHFAPFSKKLQLREVIVGAESTISRQELKDALGDMNAIVSQCKARLAFRSFSVVRQQDGQLWA